MTQERIVAAACKVEGLTVSLPPPARHGCIIKAIWNVNRKLSAVPPRGQGFLTDTGRFVGREEAFVIARDTGQIAAKHPPNDMLFSEDLW